MTPAQSYLWRTLSTLRNRDLDAFLSHSRISEFPAWVAEYARIERIGRLMEPRRSEETQALESEWLMSALDSFGHCGQ